MHYALVDIGSPRRGNFGWRVTGPLIEDGGTGPEDLISTLTEAVPGAQVRCKRHGNGSCSRSRDT